MYGDDDCAPLFIRQLLQNRHHLKAGKGVAAWGLAEAMYAQGQGCVRAVVQQVAVLRAARQLVLHALTAGGQPLELQSVCMQMEVSTGTKLKCGRCETNAPQAARLIQDNSLLCAAR